MRCSLFLLCTTIIIIYSHSKLQSTTLHIVHFTWKTSRRCVRLVWYCRTVGKTWFRLSTRGHCRSSSHTVREADCQMSQTAVPVCCVIFIHWAQAECNFHRSPSHRGSSPRIKAGGQLRGSHRRTMLMLTIAWRGKLARLPPTTERLLLYSDFPD